jgi:glycine C-acetyltransferase
MLCSNNYLGLASHPALAEAAAEAARRYGTSSGASRLVSGTMELHRQLEEAIAVFKGTEEALVFNSGYAANTGIIASLCGRDDVIFSDRLNHASIVDGILLSRARFVRYPHNDMAALATLLAETPCRGERLIVTDGVFSMDGDLGPVAALCEVAEESGAIMMVDDAHASGVFGRNGRGTIDHFDVHGRVHIQVGTLSKAIGTLGGYVAGSRALIDYLRQKARPFIFSTSHPPAVMAASIAAIEVLQEEPDIIERLWENTRFYQAGLRAMGFNTGATEGPITPVIVGESATAMRFSARLFEEGVFAQGMGFPIVPRGKARIRTIVTAAHTRDELQYALDTLKRVGIELGIV